MIESKNEASTNLEKSLQALEQAKQRVANEKKKQNESRHQAIRGIANRQQNKTKGARNLMEI